MSTPRTSLHAATRHVGRLEQRRERLLQEAERQFLSKGYAGASVNEIVRVAGGSLATLYGEFGSKEGLFAEIMRRRASAMFDSEAAQCPKQPKSTRAALLTLAQQLLDRILRQDSLALYRISISEGPRFPELRKAILEGSLPSFVQNLGAALVGLGIARRRDCVVAAEEFISLVHGQLVFRAACSDGQVISTKCRAKHVERAVEAFLRLYPPID